MFIEPVVRTYRDLGIDAAYRPINDIHVDGRKIGGTAAAILDQATVLGGMFLFDFDAATMARCLKVPSEKFRDKLQTTLEDYVTSMRRLAPRALARNSQVDLLRHVADCLNVVPQNSVTDVREDAAVAEEAVRLSDPAWTSRTGRKFVSRGVKVAADTYLTEGSSKAPEALSAQLLTREDRIIDIEISGDFTCHPPSEIEVLADRLRGASLSGSSLVDTIAGLIVTLGLELPGVGPEHLAAAIERSRQSAT
jgi:lipoate-protein ligase A